MTYCALVYEAAADLDKIHFAIVVIPEELLKSVFRHLYSNSHLLEDLRSLIVLFDENRLSRNQDVAFQRRPISGTSLTC